MDEMRKSRIASESESATRLDASIVESGCVVLFSGLSSLEFRIQAILNSRWTRCAIALPGPDGNPHLLQSTSRPIVADITTGKCLTGVQMVALADVLSAFQGKMCFRSFAPPLSSAQTNALVEFSVKKRGLPFNDSPYYALRAARRRNREGDGTRYYCTELVAAALQDVSVLSRPPIGRCASNYVPGDFAAASEDLSLSHGYTLSDEITISCPRSATV